MRCNIPNADLHQKLHDTVGRYKGIPYYIMVPENGRRAGNDLVLSPLAQRGEGPNSFRIKSNDPDFDVASPPIGYINVKETHPDDPYGKKSIDKVYYMTRTPVRRVKQGLYPQLVKAVRVNGKNQNKHSSAALMFTTSFADMVMNTYPDVKTAINNLREAYAKDPRANAEIPVSRDIALCIGDTGTISVYFKTEPVGWIEPDKFIVNVIDKKMGWVIETYLSDVLGWEIKK